MGSGEGDGELVDFYHYEPTNGSEYSAAIVTGNAGGDYRSGWPELALTRVAYKEQLRREFLCGLLTVDDAVRVGIAALGAARECPCSILRPARRGSRLEKDEQQG